MAVVRDRPYPGFNFLVDLGGGKADGPQAGFAEVSGLSAELEPIEYRNGNHKDAAPLKLPGLARQGDVTLRRGLIGTLDLVQWFQQARNGDAGARRRVVIQLLSEDRAQVAMTWKLLQAWPRRLAHGPLDAGKSQLAIEELVLACERVEIE